MSKTVEIQIEKTRSLIGGLRRHVEEEGEQLTSTSQIDQMEQALAVLAEANDEVDRLRGELTSKVKRMNDILTSVKSSFATAKKSLKGHYPQERWTDYGIPDKR